MLKVGGIWVSPVEVENALIAHPAVARVAIVGIPDERLGEVGAAFIIRKPGAEATGDPDVAGGTAEMPIRFLCVLCVLCGEFGSQRPTPGKEVR